MAPHVQLAFEQAGDEVAHKLPRRALFQVLSAVALRVKLHHDLVADTQVRIVVSILDGGSALAVDLVGRAGSVG